MDSRDISRLPPRYGEDMSQLFRARIDPTLVPGVRVLDVGAGTNPTIAVADRPAGCSYVGLDKSLAELSKAPRGSYNDLVVRDVADRAPELAAQFDLIVSWQVLEHVRPLDVAFENLRSYLRPGGLLVAQLSGGFSVFALLNRLTPHAVVQFISQHVHKRDPATVFPAHYHRCYYSALRRTLAPWHEVEIFPHYRGAAYFAFSPRLQRAYLNYEEWAHARGRRNLATHYLVVAVR